MLVTPNYCIFMQHPFKVNGLPFLLGFKSMEQCFNFNSKEPTKIIIISRHEFGKMEILETESFFGFHHGNAWEKDGNIYLQSICANSYPKKEKEELDLEGVNFSDFPTGNLWQFTLSLSSKTVVREKIETRGCDYPSVHPQWVGKEHRYLYMSVTHSPLTNGPNQDIMKLDKKSGERQIWSPGARGFAGEPVFVPRPGGTQEDDGWIISMVYDASLHRTYIVILNAEDITQVVAKLNLSHHIPQGFHGTWTSEIFLSQ